MTLLDLINNIKDLDIEKILFDLKDSIYRLTNNSSQDWRDINQLKKSVVELRKDVDELKLKKND